MNVSRMEMQRIRSAETLDKSQFTATILDHRGQFYAIAYSYLRSESDALEALQEATFRAWSKRATLKNPLMFKTWFIRILINICIDERRRRERVLPFEEDQGIVGASTEMNQDRVEMLEILNQIKPKYRHVLLLKYYHDFTYVEIASILSRSEGTVKSWQRQGLKLLRKLMKSRGEWNNE